MNLELISRQTNREDFIFSGKRVNLARRKRQRILSNNLSHWFTPKAYPSIFLDQRLRSQFFK